MHICDNCGRCVFGSDKSHTCPAEWEARIPEFHGEDWTVVKGAYDAEAAAESLAEDCDGNRDLTECRAGWLVEVRKPGDEGGTVHRFRVTAEPRVDYSAEEQS
jgi:hypothetical protein